jgi:class 3 adenylate cyclase
VSVLFCDVVESTALAARLGPEAMHALLNRFFELALDEVHRYEGTVNQVMAHTRCGILRGAADARFLGQALLGELSAMPQIQKPGTDPLEVVDANLLSLE